MVTEKDVLNVMEIGGNYLGCPIYGVDNAEKIVIGNTDLKTDKVYFNGKAVNVIRPSLSNDFLRFIPLNEISRNDLSSCKNNSFYSIFFRKSPN